MARRRSRRTCRLTSSGTRRPTSPRAGAPPLRRAAARSTYEWRVTAPRLARPPRAPRSSSNNVGAGTYTLEVRAINLGSGETGPTASDTVGVSNPPPPTAGTLICKGRSRLPRRLGQPVRRHAVTTTSRRGNYRMHDGHACQSGRLEGGYSSTQVTSASAQPPASGTRQSSVRFVLRANGSLHGPTRSPTTNSLTDDPVATPLGVHARRRNGGDTRTGRSGSRTPSAARRQHRPGDPGQARGRRARARRLLAEGHVLLEDVPGTGKTMLAQGARQHRRTARARAHPVHARPAAVRRHRRHGLRPGAAAGSSSTPGRSSPTSCSPTRSTAPRRRPSRRCSRSWRSARSPSTASRTGRRGRSW